MRKDTIVLLHLSHKWVIAVSFLLWAITTPFFLFPTYIECELSGIIYDVDTHTQRIKFHIAPPYNLCFFATVDICLLLLLLYVIAIQRILNEANSSNSIYIHIFHISFLCTSLLWCVYSRTFTCSTAFIPHTLWCLFAAMRKNKAMRMCEWQRSG